MIELIFVRHAKAEENTSEFDDFYRSLTTKGKLDAQKISNILKSKLINPELIISSPAFRAYETACIFANNLNYNLDHIKVLSRLYYHISINDIIEQIKQSNIEKGKVMIFGHNPTISYLAQSVSNFSDFMPTCSAVSVTLKSLCNQDINKTTDFNYFEYPKKYK